MPESSIIPICRFLCAIFLHIYLADELEQGFLLMKYPMNHAYKFDSWFSAFLIGFSQMFVTITIELVNIAVLLTNSTVMETIMNFLALVIISEFDDYFLNTIKDSPLFSLLHDGKVAFYK